MPSLTPEQLQAARRASGNLGGRPRKPTVEEARRVALEELVPKSLQVLRAHLGEGDAVNPDAWRAALRVFEHAFGRAPEQAEPVIELPATVEAVRAMGWREMEVLAGRLIQDVPGVAQASIATDGAAMDNELPSTTGC
jgi:hypothetical protein